MSAGVKLVVRLPGFVTQELFLNALSESDRTSVTTAQHFAFVAGKPKARALSKRLSFAWISFADAAAALAFCRSSASALQFRESEAGALLQAQFDFALYQTLPAAPVAAPATAQTFSFASHPDFATFRTAYDSGDIPLLTHVVSSVADGAAQLAKGVASNASTAVAADAASGSTTTPPVQTPIVEALLSKQREKAAKATAKETAKATKKATKKLSKKKWTAAEKRANKAEKAAKKARKKMLRAGVTS
jgi:hypothetical protein